MVAGTTKDRDGRVMESVSMSWKELAVALATDKGHETFCEFGACCCGAVERQLQWITEIHRKTREERG